jgi:hypothetical protein
MRVFFSHPMKLYGTEVERRQLALIKQHFVGCEVLDPSQDRPAAGLGEKEELDYYLRLVDSCDSLVFSRLFGNITEGVRPEVEHALAQGKEVYELRESRFIRVTGPVSDLPFAERIILRAKGALGMAR